MLNLNDQNIHENPFKISFEEMAATTPFFSVNKEDDDVELETV